MFQCSLNLGENQNNLCAWPVDFCNPVCCLISFRGAMKNRFDRMRVGVAVDFQQQMVWICLGHQILGEGSWCEVVLVKARFTLLRMSEVVTPILAGSFLISL